MGAILRNASKIAGRQLGVISAAQLIELGLSRSGIDKWVQKGLLYREFRGVYRFGHAAPSIDAHYRAAVLPCGPGSALSGMAAAYPSRLIKRPPLSTTSPPSCRSTTSPGPATRPASSTV